MMRLLSLMLLLASFSVGATVIPSRMADDFVESAAVCTHLTYTDKAYYSQWPTVRQRLIDLGVRHIRDGGASADFVNKIRELSTDGVRTIWVLDPGAGIVPTTEFWSPSSVQRQLLVPWLKNNRLTNAVSAVEVMNEIDLFYNRSWIADYSQAGYFWRAGNTSTTNHLSNDSASALWWGKYIVAMTSNTWNVVKGDAQTAAIKIIGPSFGAFHDSPPTGANSLRDFVDWGCFHPYPFGGNSYSVHDPYATVDWYIGHGQQPSCNIDEWPLAFSSYQGAFGSKPMAATETGWYTGTAGRAVSESAQAKYVPRLYLEYFAQGIARCAHYELLDEGTNTLDNEQNRGLLRSDLSPKPAYTALQNLLGLLADPGPAFATHPLNLTISKTMPPGYSRSQYLRNLLFQKRDGSFWLVLWHEIASSSYYTSGGQEITGVARDIAHPDVTVKLTFATPIANATVFRPNLSQAAQTNFLTPQAMSVPVNDSPVLIKLDPDPPRLKASMDNALSIQVAAQTNHVYTVETSTNLLTWTLGASFTLTNSPQDVGALPPATTFFRARTQ